MKTSKFLLVLMSLLTLIVHLSSGKEMELFDKQGRSFQAKIIEVTEDAAKVIRSSDNKEFTLRFDTLSSKTVEKLKEYKAYMEALANAVRLRGEIRQIVDEGMLVFAHYGNQGMPVYDTGKDRPKLVYGNFLLKGHPTQKQKVDDDWFDVDAIPDGIFEYKTVTGASKRVKAFKVVKAYK